MGRAANPGTANSVIRQRRPTRIRSGIRCAFGVRRLAAALAAPNRPHAPAASFRSLWPLAKPKRRQAAALQDRVVLRRDGIGRAANPRTANAVMRQRRPMRCAFGLRRLATVLAAPNRPHAPAASFRSLRPLAKPKRRQTAALQKRVVLCRDGIGQAAHRRTANAAISGLRRSPYRLVLGE